MQNEENEENDVLKKAEGLLYDDLLEDLGRQFDALKHQTIETYLYIFWYLVIPHNFMSKACLLKKTKISLYARFIIICNNPTDNGLKIMYSELAPKIKKSKTNRLYCSLP